MKMAEYVIIGNGVAAVGCVEGVRSIDKTSPITVVSEEPYPVYGRPLISYYLEKKTTLDKMNYRKPDFYSSNGCRVLYGKKAVKIDKKEKKNPVLEVAYQILTPCPFYHPPHNLVVPEH